MGAGLPPLDWGSFLTQWQLRPVWSLLIAAALAAYLLGLRTARRRGERGVGSIRVASFVTGLVVLAVTVNSSIAVYAELVFWMHMVEHLLLIMVVPALLVVGHPLTVLVAARPGARRVLASGPVAFLTRPLVGFVVYGGVIVATHLTSFMDRTMLHPALAPGEQVLYLLAGYLFLLPLLGDEPIRWHPPRLFRILMMVVGMIPDTVVGIVLLQTGKDLFPVMLGAGDRPAWAPDAVHDLNIGGGLMWAGGDGLMMVFAIGLVIALIARPERTDLLGGWLEGVRRSTMQGHVGTDPGDVIGDTDLDRDDAALAAYNRMLERMNRQQ